MTRNTAKQRQGNVAKEIQHVDDDKARQFIVGLICTQLPLIGLHCYFATVLKLYDKLDVSQVHLPIIHALIAMPFVYLVISRLRNDI